MDWTWSLDISPPPKANLVEAEIYVGTPVVHSFECDIGGSMPAACATSGVKCTGGGLSMQPFFLQISGKHQSECQLNQSLRVVISPASRYPNAVTPAKAIRARGQAELSSFVADGAAVFPCARLVKGL